MQLSPDWRMTATKERFEQELGLEFKGPGWYLSNTDSVLVIPHPPEVPAYEKVWHVRQPKGTVYDVNVYNCQRTETVFSYLTTAPTRIDERA